MLRRIKVYAAGTLIAVAIGAAVGLSLVVVAAAAVLGLLTLPAALLLQHAAPADSATADDKGAEVAAQATA